MTAEPKMLPVEGVAVLLGVSAVTVLRWVRQGRFPKGTPYGGFKRVGWTPEVVDAWLAERERNAANGARA